MDAPPPLLGVVGPTGSGKTDLALALARRLPVEILVADSRQVYRGMDVGTAKPDVATRAVAAHHLIDLADPDQAFSVADWVERARALIPAIVECGHLPMLVGGTGLYISALVGGHDYAHQAGSAEVRARLTEELEREGLPPLVERLKLRAPEAAAQIDRHNPRRVLRALERVEAGGGAVPAARPYRGPVALVAIGRPREALYRRINARAREMFATGGLVDEVRGLRDAGYRADLHPMTGHGYGEAMRVLAGEWDVETAIEVTARRTRQYAKRQLTWFRRDGRLHWLSAGDRAADEPDLVNEAERLLRTALS